MKLKTKIMATQQDQLAQSPEGQKSNLAPSAVFIKKNVLDRFYPQAAQKGLVDEANAIMTKPGDENGTECIEFRIGCRDIADQELAAVHSEPVDAETKKKKVNAWNNFTSNLITNVRPPDAPPETPSASA